jgi:hypothetical protein
MVSKNKTAIVYTCAHADPNVSNERFDWLGELIKDIKPDYVVDLGDGADMRSLNSFDTRKPEALVAENYEQDINSYLDAQERIREPYKKTKRKRPAYFGFEGNHENRIRKAIAVDPRLEGDKYGVSFNHLETDLYFTEYHPYANSAPSIASYDGVHYAHFIGAGAFGRPISGEYHAANLVKKLGASATVGHSHKLSYYHKAESFPSPTNGLVAGCFKGAQESWAGQANREWAKGVCIKRNLRHGQYDLQWISLDALKKEYGNG